MRRPEIAPELFSDKDETMLKPGENWQSIDVETTPDGGYNGNGKFTVPKEGLLLTVKGFDRRKGREIWFSKGWIIIRSDQNGYL